MLFLPSSFRSRRTRIRKDRGDTFHQVSYPSPLEPIRSYRERLGEAARRGESLPTHPHPVSRYGQADHPHRLVRPESGSLLLVRPASTLRFPRGRMLAATCLFVNTRLTPLTLQHRNSAHNNPSVRLTYSHLPPSHPLLDHTAIFQLVNPQPAGAGSLTSQTPHAPTKYSLHPIRSPSA
jgi:hypothetical protein